jgi:large subunit ribosomal protein L21
MYAIIKTGGKQYRVQKDDVFKVEKLNAEVGDKITFDEVVAVGGDKLIVGNPFVEGYAVKAEVLEQGKNDKVIIYKYKAKKDYRRKNGHRQPYTLVKITDIAAGGRSSVKAEAKAEAKAEDAPKTKAPAKAKSEPKAKAAPKAKADTVAAPSINMKKDELLAIAKDMGIDMPSKATKADILAAIESK